MTTNKNNAPASYSSPLCTLTLTPQGYALAVQCESGQTVALKPFKADQSGLVAAISLIAEIEAGKFWLVGTVATQPTQAPPQPQRLAAPRPPDLVTVSVANVPTVVDVQPTSTAKPAQPSPQPAKANPFTVNAKANPLNKPATGGGFNFGQPKR